MNRSTIACTAVPERSGGQPGGDDTVTDFTNGEDTIDLTQITGINAFLLIHEAQQGCRDATYEPSRFPIAVPYPSPHRATPAYVVVTSSDLDTSRNKASVSGLSWISRNAFDDLTITADGTSAVIDLSDYGGGEIRLENVAVADLDAEDFNFYEAPSTRRR